MAAASGRNEISSETVRFADYIAGTLDRKLPPEVEARTKQHILDAFASMVSGSKLRPGQIAAGYVESLGGKPEATVIGSRFLTSSVHAALANAMSAHADETDDTNPVGPVHLGCITIPAALATAEIAGRSGQEFLRAVTLGYDIGSRVVAALGANEHSQRLSPPCIPSSITSASVAAALLRLDQRQVRHTISYATQQTSGTPIWRRDTDHIQKAFDFGGSGARNGVMAATMVKFGFTGVEDPFTGRNTIYSALAENPAPEKLLADLGTKFSVFDTTIKKWSVGMPVQSVMNGVAELLKDPGVTSANISRVIVEMAAYSLAIVDNANTPNLCAQHLVAMMLVDHGANFHSVHDAERMTDPKVLAMRALVELRGREDFDHAKPPRQSVITIELKDGRSLSKHTTYIRGLAQNPLDQAEVEEKALDLMAPVLGGSRARDLIAAINSIETLDSILALRPLLQA